ncbi:jerky protein homolog-like [Anastrepha obliqua]|uniref:jerky protein homolog-like n=1 Tax=Anastrepha obliqua TaxID=95512 RepID=UPI0024091784|nr:jerky protein homolog-like [Anastrepha obliqua]
MFVEDLNEYIKNEQLTTEQIYNVDETGLFWKCLPQNSLASGDEYSIEGYKESKERITALLCANAAGTHKFYKSNKRAWVTQELFLEWFNNNFVPEVREHLQRIGLEKNCKVLLLLDNCPAHPDVNAMISDNVTVKYLPPNCTSLIQPMDQGAIRSFKCQYRKFIVQKLVDSNSRHEFVKSLNIKSALWTAATSWDSVTPRVLNKVWNNLLSQDDENDSTFSIEIQSDVLIPPGFTADAISKWMECDIDVAPFAIVSDDEIVNMVNQTEEYELESNSEESDGGNTLHGILQPQRQRGSTTAQERVTRLTTWKADIAKRWSPPTSPSPAAASVPIPTTDQALQQVITTFVFKLKEMLYPEMLN